MTDSTCKNSVSFHTIHFAGTSNGIDLQDVRNNRITVTSTAASENVKRSDSEETDNNDVS